MALNKGGLPRKEDGDRLRANPRRYHSEELEWDGNVRGPELPADFTWCPRTVQWWEMWRASAQAMMMVETDWEVFLETAVLHNKLWTNPGSVRPAEATALAGEIRRRVGVYGATHLDRQSLGWKIRTDQSERNDEAKIDMQAKSQVDYATRLLKKTAKGSD